jgi:hypothetical protein
MHASRAGNVLSTRLVHIDGPTGAKAPTRPKPGGLTAASESLLTHARSGVRVLARPARQMIFQPWSCMSSAPASA